MGIRIVLVVLATILAAELPVEVADELIVVLQLVKFNGYHCRVVAHHLVAAATAVGTLVLFHL